MRCYSLDALYQRKVNSCNIGITKSVATRTLPTPLGDINRRARNDGLDRELDVTRGACSRRRRALALLDRACDAAADREDRDVRSVEVERSI